MFLFFDFVMRIKTISKKIIKQKMHWISLQLSSMATAWSLLSATNTLPVCSRKSPSHCFFRFKKQRRNKEFENIFSSKYFTFFVWRQNKQQKNSILSCWIKMWIIICSSCVCWCPGVVWTTISAGWIEDIHFCVFVLNYFFLRKS